MKTIKGFVKRRIGPFASRVARTGKLKLLQSQINQLKGFLESGNNEDKREYISFKGKTSNLWYLKSHVTMLAPGIFSTRPRSHVEEELIVILSGELEIILYDSNYGDNGQKRYRLRAGELLFYPSGILHVNHNPGDRDALYYVFKWYSPAILFGSKPHFFIYSWLQDIKCTSTQVKGHITKVLFEFPTEQLNKLHCHITTMSPGAGYEPHVDEYDVAIVVLKGHLRTLGCEALKNDIIFYAAGEPHSMKNTGDETAVYLVFELHRNSDISLPRYVVNPMIKLGKKLKRLRISRQES